MRCWWILWAYNNNNNNNNADLLSVGKNENMKILCKNMSISLFAVLLQRLDTW